MPSMVPAIGTIPRVVHPDKGKGWEETLLIPAENLNILHFRFFSCSFFLGNSGSSKGEQGPLGLPTAATTSGALVHWVLRTVCNNKSNL